MGHHLPNEAKTLDFNFKMASLEEKLLSIEDVDIDESGKFKYILIKVSAGSKSKFIVRGFDWAEFHGTCQYIISTRSINIPRPVKNRLIDPLIIFLSWDAGLNNFRAYFPAEQFRNTATGQYLPEYNIGW